MIIYKLTSPSNKSYIGLTTTDLETRFKQHVNDWLRIKRTDGDYKGRVLYYAFDKYGADNFTKEVVFEAQTIDELKLKEIEIISMLGRYNVLPGGDSGWAGLKMTQAHRAAMSAARKAFYQTDDGKRWLAESSARYMGNKFSVGVEPSNKGKVGFVSHTPEARAKISAAMKGRIKSEQHKAAISASKVGKRLDDEVYARQAASRTGVPRSQVAKDAIALGNSSQWIITFPDGHSETITNLRKFALDNGLDQGNLCATAKHTNRKHKGYSARRA